MAEPVSPVAGRTAAEMKVDIDNNITASIKEETSTGPLGSVLQIDPTHLQNPPRRIVSSTIDSARQDRIGVAVPLQRASAAANTQGLAMEYRFLETKIYAALAHYPQPQVVGN